MHHQYAFKKHHFIMGIKNSAALITLLLSLVFIMPHLAYAQSVIPSQLEKAQKIADFFASIKTMTGDFIQFGPKGEMSEGTFYLERPGKIRFSYKNSPVRVITDGKSVAINNRKLDTWDLYQLSQTPMKMLLDTTINLRDGKLLGIQEDQGATTLILADKTIGNGQIRMIFDNNTNELRQWTIVDAQNLETTLQVLNVRTGVRFQDGMFDIPYQRIATKHKER